MMTTCISYFYILFSYVVQNELVPARIFHILHYVKKNKLNKSLNKIWEAIKKQFLGRSRKKGSSVLSASNADNVAPDEFVLISGMKSHN